MPSNPILTQPTSPLNKDPPLDKGNLICLIECLPQLKAILYFMVVMHFMVFNSMFHPLPFHTTNHGVRDTNWIQLSVPKHVPTFNLINSNIIPQKDIIIPYMTQTCYLLNSQIFVKFFFFVTMPETLHYTEFITKYCPKYVRLIFSLYFMTKILFSTSLLPLPTPFSLIQPIPSATQPLSLPTSSRLFSSHSLHLPSLYPKPASEKDPQEFTNIA